MAGQSSHPLDGGSKFHEVIGPPFHFDPQGLLASMMPIPSHSKIG